MGDRDATDGIEPGHRRLQGLVGTVAMVSMHTSPLVQPGVGDGGGMNVFVRELGGALARAGVAVRCYVRRDRTDLETEVAVEPGFDVVHVEAGAPDTPKEELPALVEPFAERVEEDLASRGDVVALHANYWLSAVAAHRIKHDLSLPLIATFHTLARVKAEGGDPEPESRVAAERAVIGCADAVTAATPLEAMQLVELYGADPDRIELVAPGVDRAFFSPGDRAGARWAASLPDAPTILFVGRIQPLKGLDVAIAALAEVQHPDARLVVVGGASGADGDAELARVRALADELGVADRITWVDPQPHHLLSSYYRAADVVVVPSRSESFGLVALEAAACGIPVVASAVGGLSRLVVDCDTGLLVPMRTSTAFATAIDVLLDDPDLAARMGARAAERSTLFTWSAAAARLRRCYADVVQRTLVSCRP
jgi:D-inositol-3-phosphate glycosyltransferase